MKDLQVNLIEQDGVVLVSSRIVAEELGKEHSDVTRKIRDVLTVGEFSEREFIYNDGKNKATEYLLNKDSFVLLVMNYQGYNDFKID